MSPPVQSGVSHMFARRLFVAPLLALLVVTSSSSARADEARTVTVTGEGSVSAVPDTALISAGVVSQAATAAEALAANSSSTAAVIERVKGEGVAPADIQTSSFSLQPVTVYPRPDSGEQSAPRITGYTVSNTVTVRVRDLARLGALLDSAISAGANNVGGVEFQVSRESELLDRARQQAVEDARRKAALYATAAGARLGSVLTLSEQAGHAPPRPMYRMEAAAAQVPVEAGQTELNLQITATFRLE
jgi:uncharacterized protein YggE